MSVPVRFFAVVLVLLLTASFAQATVFNVDLNGKAGPGLLPGNENPTVGPPAGSGGEFGPGLSYDNVTKNLSIDVAWGSVNGFTDLSGNAIAGHIHGPTAHPPPLSLNESAGVMIPLDTLPGWNPSASSGGVLGTVNFTATQESQLFNGQ